MPLKPANIFKKKGEKSKLVKSVVNLDYRNIFGLAFLLGSTFIILGWLLNSLILFGVILPIFTLLAYSSLGFIEEKNKALIEQFADSIYYLGFLFTLVALIVSLVALSEADYSIKGVGSRFGIALATTIIGLFLRIFLTNFRASLTDKRTIVEDQFAKSMKEFSYQVQIHARTLRTTTELYSSSSEISIDLMNKTIATLTSSLESASTQGVSQIVKTFQNANEQLELIKISEDVLVSPIQEPIKLLVKLIEEYRDSFVAVTHQQKKISEDNKLFSNNLNELNESTAQINNSMQKIAETFSSVKELDINTSTLNNTIDKTVSTIGNLSSSLSELTVIQPNIQSFISSIADIDRETEKLSETIKNHEKVISNIDGISNFHLEMVRKHQNEIEETMKKSRKNLKLLNESLIKSANYITDEIGRGSGGGSK